MSSPRVAYLPDTFHEVNGVARTGRHFAAYARAKHLPFLCVCPGRGLKQWRFGTVRHLEIPRSQVSVPIERDLRMDPAILRHWSFVRSAFRAFRPDIVHVTSMGDFGVLGWLLACESGLPMAASWHTNVHEYGAWRLRQAAALLPVGARTKLAAGFESVLLGASLWFYRRGAVALAPNPALLDLVRQGTGRPTFLMERGVDTAHFDPMRRNLSDAGLVFGYVGRLSPEKNLRVLGSLERALQATGRLGYRIEIVGHGSESGWLSANLRRCNLRGVLKGRRLAQAYANMDVFLFPSRTDTYGNVVWESAASGVPAVVMNAGGPPHFVRHGVTGLVSQSGGDFGDNALRLLRDPDCRLAMGRAARKAALAQSWEAVFDGLYSQAYRAALKS